MQLHDHGSDTAARADAPDTDADEWDRFYTGEDGRPHWSGRPNLSLVAEVADLRPGRALDVGCGEGADAIWLAQQGWQVTAIDPSRVALDRAEAAARTAGVDVTWLSTGLLGLPSDQGPYDLVSAMYPVLRRDDDDAAMASLLDAVASGGRLLFVHHELDGAHAAEHGFDVAAHVMPHDVADHLDRGWEIEHTGTRAHPGHGDTSDEHPPDVVLRARRLTRA